jgi:hypothetical protein
LRVGLTANGKEGAMLRTSSWAVGIVLMLAPVVVGQDTEPEKIPLPVKPPIKMDAPASEGTTVIPMDYPRRTSLVYANADYLLWFVHHGPAPDMLTTAPGNGLNANGLTGGVIGQPGTQIIFTGDDLNYHVVSGIRVAIGVNLGDDGFWSLQADGLYLAKRNINATFNGNSDGLPLLTLPFIDAASGIPSALDINSQNAAGAPFLNGSISFHSDLSVWGYEANAIAHSIRTPQKSVDIMFGYRQLSLTENLLINQTLVIPPAPPGSPSNEGNITLQFPTAGQGNYLSVKENAPVYITDSFGTRNMFYGAQVGTRFRWDFGNLSANLTGKVALGVTHQQVAIEGSTTATAVTTATGGTATNLTTPGGVFALQGNSGNFSQNQFTVVPEIGLNLKYAVTSWFSVQIGYTGLYWSNVARPGAQMDNVINSKLIPTGPFLATNTVPPGAFVPGAEQGRPYFTFRDTAFWAHGVNFGVEFRY